MHTQGPWQPSSANAFHRAMVFAYPNQRQVAIAALTEGNDADANARLIAAAPELLAALRKCEIALAVNSMTDLSENALADARQAARAAIAKAQP
jgi:hypothetical protein